MSEVLPPERTTSSILLQVGCLQKELRLQFYCR
jgi:hypothetical protein